MVWRWFVWRRNAFLEVKQLVLHSQRVFITYRWMLLYWPKQLVLLSNAAFISFGRMLLWSAVCVCCSLGVSFLPISSNFLVHIDNRLQRYNIFCEMARVMLLFSIFFIKMWRNIWLFPDKLITLHLEKDFISYFLCRCFGQAVNGADKTTVLGVRAGMAPKGKIKK